MTATVVLPVRQQSWSGHGFASVRPCDPSYYRNENLSTARTSITRRRYANGSSQNRQGATDREGFSFRCLLPSSVLWPRFFSFVLGPWLFMKRLVVVNYLRAASRFISSWCACWADQERRTTHGPGTPNKELRTCEFALHVRDRYEKRDRVTVRSGFLSGAVVLWSDRAVNCERCGQPRRQPEG